MYTILLSLILLCNIFVCWCLVAINKNKKVGPVNGTTSIGLNYEQLFRFLDVIIVNEVKNFIAVNNLSSKDSSMLSISIDESIVELSTKIYTKCISPVLMSEFKKYVKEEFLMEYISRSIRNNLIGGSYKK